MMPPSDPRPSLSPSATVLAQQRRQLGTARQQMAVDLAQARRRNLELEQELARLRPSTDPAGTVSHPEATTHLILRAARSAL
jgi:hypothetical protein